MTAELKKELFIGKYLPFEPVAALPKGSIVQGKNLLRGSIFGGWAPRRGYSLINTTAEANGIDAIHSYINPFFNDFHLFTQEGGGLYSLASSTEILTTETGEVLITSSTSEELLATTAAEPLAQRATLGSSLIDVGEGPSFSCLVGENWVYCDGTYRPIIFGGSAPRCDGFIVSEGATGTLIDYTDDVNDIDSNTSAIITANASTKYYVGMKERGSEIHLIFSQANTNAVTATVKAFRSGSWTDVSASDGTNGGTDTHELDAALTWSSSASDAMSVIANRQLYWYEISFSGAPTEIHIDSCRVVWPLSLMTNKWDSEFHYVEGALFYDASGTEYIDKLGAVTDDSQSTYMDVSSMQTGDYIYFKTIEPLLGIGFKMVEGNINTANAQFDLLETITSAGWATVGTFTDETLDTAADSSLSGDGVVWVVNEHSPQQATFQGDQAPGYWYRISADAALSVTTQISELVYAAWPKDLHSMVGCVEYDSKLILWGEAHYQNRLLVSPANKPDLFAFHDEKYTIPFGGSDPIKNCLVLGDFLVVWKAANVYLTNRDFDDKKTLASGIGLASPRTAVVISSGDKTLKDDEVQSIALWQDRSGIYKATESKQISRISGQIENFFLPSKSEYIGDEYIETLQATYHPPTDTYRLFLPDRTLCYSIGTAEWLPEWYYSLTPGTGLYTIGPDREGVLLYGTSGGFIFLVERVTSDRNASNTQIAINHEFTTRPIFGNPEDNPALTGVLRQIWSEFLVDSGSYTITLYENRQTSGSALTTPTSPSLAASGYEVSVQKFDLGKANIRCFQLKFASDTVDQTMEIYSFMYHLDELRAL